MSLFVFIDHANIGYVFIVAHTEILGKFHVVSVQAFVEALVNLKHFRLLF